MSRIVKRVWIPLVKSGVVLLERFTFERRLARHLKSVIATKSPVVLDVGANTGQTILFWKKYFDRPTLHSFEVNPACVRILRNKNFQDVTIHGFGLSSKNGTLPFHVNALDLTSSFEVTDETSDYEKMKARVLGVAIDKLVQEVMVLPVRKLADVLNENGLQQIDLLKIDVEGHEYQVLQGLFHGSKKFNITRIQLESHSDRTSRSQYQFEIERLLSNEGYEEEVRFKHAFGSFEDVIYKLQPGN